MSDEKPKDLVEEAVFNVIKGGAKTNAEIRQKLFPGRGELGCVRAVDVALQKLRKEGRIKFQGGWIVGDRVTCPTCGGSGRVTQKP